MNFHRISRTLIRLGAAITAAALLIPGCRKNEKNDLTVTEIIIVDPNSRYLDMTQGDGALIQYDVVPSEALNTAVLEWSSDNESVATVMNGYVSAYAPGNATITAKCGNAETTVTVSVKPVPVTSFTVPETLFLYTGYETVLEMTIEPEKANAASLDWEYDSEYLSMSFNEGKAVFTGLKKGNTTITVKSEKAGTKTVQVSIRDIESRLIVSYNKRIDSIGNYKTITLKDGDEVIWDQMYPSDYSYDPYYPDITVLVGPDISVSGDVNISCSDESICKEFRPLPVGTTDKRAAYTLYNGDGFGTADVTVTAYDQKFDTERKLQFKLTREAKGFPGELIVHGPKSTTIRNGDTYRMDKNTSVYFSVDDGYQVKWTVESGNALTLEHSGDVYWSKYAKVTTADKTGQVTIKVTDQTGKSMSFTVNVTEQVFPDDIYVMYEDGTRLKDGDELLIGHDYKLKLSNSDYRGKWTIEDAELFGENWDQNNPYYYNTITYRPKEYSYSGSSKLTVTDKSGLKKLEYNLKHKYSLEDCRFSISDKGPSSMTDGVSTTNYIPWTGTSTNNEIILYLYYSDGKKTIKVNPWQLSGAEQNINSGRLKIDIEYLSNGSALRQNNRVVFQQYYYYYKLTWKTAAGAFNIRFTDGNIVRKVPFYSTIDMKNLKDYAFFEYFSHNGAGSLMKNGEPSIFCAYTNKANYNIMFAHTSNLTKNADGDWVFNAGLRDLAYSTETMGDVVAIESICYQPRSSIYNYLIFHGITGKEVAKSIAYECFSYKSTEKPFYLYFRFKGAATDSYGNTWPHDKYNLQRRSLWYL